ncbi:uncharacterized protein LOC110503656 isoform X2 [Oncorhynchus mykiss]|uniref:uncharacterized protein LOC110503656 isoform X2 n=1 Tax=Oncorhynchus mykiss TaxID=8022 RepID=UPI001877A6FF|nr:uncharacterized protein LOC110503656 isoform X2 [Oncorhynchus mykiss]
MGKKEMYNCLFLSWTCLCFLPGYDSEECVTSVLAKRGSVDVPKGGTLSLSCDVQHCGNDGWTGGWGLSTEGQFLLFSHTPRHHLSKVTLTTNSTRLLMDILNVNQSDHGMYQCQITWVEGYTSVGHMTYVNITAAIPPTSVRKVYSRVVVYPHPSLNQRQSWSMHLFQRTALNSRIIILNEKPHSSQSTPHPASPDSQCMASQTFIL